MSLHTSTDHAHRPMGPRLNATTARSPRALARRRGALLQLALRHGEVRLQVGGGGSAPQSAAMSELLDELNEAGRLRYAGLRNGVLSYLPV